ncbi:MAG: glycosyltransferase family 39 protein [Planctomycetota bacterium]
MKDARSRFKDLVILIAFAGALLAAFLRCLPDYNSPRDEFADLYCGERYWAFIASGDPAHLDFTRPTLAFYNTPEYPSNHVNLFVPHEPGLYSRHLLPLVLSAASCQLFSRTWQVFADPIHAHRFVNYFQMLLFGVVFYLVLKPRLGRALALFALLAVMLHPRVVSELFNNVKDIAIFAQYSIAMLLFLHAIDRPQRPPWWLVLLCGASIGVAAATKVNGLLLPLVFLAALIALFILRWIARQAPVAFGPWPYLVMIGTAVPVYFAVNPFFWHDFKHRLWLYFEFINDYMFSRAHADDSWFRPLEFFATFPDVLALLTVLGISLGAARALRGDARSVVVLGWLATPLVRVSLPSAVNSDGIRHFLDAVPAALILAAEGLPWLARGLAGLGAPAAGARAGVAALALAALLHESTATARSHPYQVAYFNGFAGGLSGARSNGHYTMPGDYWANCYLDVFPWLNQHAPRGSAVIVPAMIGGARPHAGDLLIVEDVPLYRRGGQQRDPQIEALAQDGKLYLVILEEPRYFASGRRLYWTWREQLKPCHEVRFQGATLASVYAIHERDLDRLGEAIKATLAALGLEVRREPELKIAFGLVQLYGQLGLPMPPDTYETMQALFMRARQNVVFFNERDTIDRISKKLAQQQAQFAREQP